MALQFAMLALEFAAPLMLLVWSNRARVALVALLLGFHVMVYAGVTIIFLPHCIAILSILPWERAPEALAALRRRLDAGRATVGAAAPPG
jgi:membrane protein implicated in regulation of membrane protease activity